MDFYLLCDIQVIQMYLCRNQKQFQFYKIDHSNWNYILTDMKNENAFNKIHAKMLQYTLSHPISIPTKTNRQFLYLQKLKTNNKYARESIENTVFFTIHNKNRRKKMCCQYLRKSFWMKTGNKRNEKERIVNEVETDWNISIEKCLTKPIYAKTNTFVDKSTK